MSSCGCSCGADCKCGSDCKCGKKFPDLSYSEEATTTTTGALVLGVAPQTTGYEGAEVAEGDGCNCGASCTCGHCNC